MAGSLYVVATPIGNLEDLSARAGRVLSEVSLVVAEDTRRTRGLLTHLGLSKPLSSLPAFAEAGRADRIIERLVSGDDVALVTDGGTPVVSDPGAELVKRAIAAGAKIIPVPGPSAVIAALSASGLPADRFHFLGFLPRKGGVRRRLIDFAADLPFPIVIYESPNRIGDTLEELAEALGPRQAVVARELTKIHETLERGTLTELASRLKETRGEVTLVIDGAPPVSEEGADDEPIEEEITRLLAAGQLSLKDIAREVGRSSGRSKRDVYALALKIARRT